MALDSGKKTTTVIIVINIVIVFNIIRDKNLALGGTLLGNKHLIAADYVAIIIFLSHRWVFGSRAEFPLKLP